MPERSVEFFEHLLRDTGDRARAATESKAFRDRRQKQKEDDEAAGTREKAGRVMSQVPESFFFLIRVFGLLRGTCAELGVSIPLIEIMALHARCGLLDDAAAAAACEPRTAAAPVQ